MDNETTTSLPGSGLYLYCVAAGNQGEDLGLKGIGGNAVYSVSTANLVAVVQECDPAISSEDEKLVSEWVLNHQAVVDFAWDRFETVVPFGFGVVTVDKDGKSARENLLEWLEKESDSLKGKIDRLKGKAEYGVQISWDPTVLKPKITRNDKEILSLEAEIASKAEGTAYLLKQKLEGLLRNRVEIAADAYFKEFFQKIKGCVEDTRVEKVRKEEPPRQMLMNLSCLLPKGDVAKLGEDLDKIGKIEGFFARFTGPWPPYSFV